MTVVTTVAQLTEIDLALPLPRYAQIINYSECAFFGVRNPDDDTRACRQVWSEWQRDQIAHYLGEAQDEIEQVVRYPLNRRWFADEEHPYGCPTFTTWGHVVEAGVQATSTIVSGEAVDHTSDPATVGPVATTVTDEDEIHIYHPGSDVEIYPSAISISGGNVTISIPRCRMVKESLVDNPTGGLDYDTVTNFESTVDIKRVYNDASTNAVLIWPCKCGNGTCSAACTEKTQTACMYLDDLEVGIVSTKAANYSGGSWATAACYCDEPSKLQLNYRAGLASLTRQAEDAIVRLAHAKMPAEPCGCNVTQQLWKRDRNIPAVLTRERINCPFGLSDGAWTAWRFANAMKLFRGSTI